MAASLKVVFLERVEERGGQFLMLKAIELKKNQTYGGPAEKLVGNTLKGGSSEYR